ncbi:MAG TPA: hypothetical protein VED01_21625 [Burkholderiales bacterium]|nr:hypothetical protein [Burkholderiales bacterium]
MQIALQRADGAGLFLIIDEVGKFLEYEMRQRRSDDAFLLQLLAEQACAPSAVPLQLMLLMHQSFEVYAKGNTENLRKDWHKLKGRFETIPFLETAEQTLRVVAAAITHDFPQSAAASVRRISKRIASELFDIGALPASLDVATASSLFERCYPLHPVTLLLLPTLCQKIAQNERTLFSYLGSSEPSGFLATLAGKQFGRELPWIRPYELYDYFVTNQSGLLADHATHRRWAEVMAASERLGDAPAREHEMLKTIGILNIVGAQGGLKASARLLSLLQPEAVDKASVIAIDCLQKKSLITFRKFNGEYRVWQGSDFDLDAAVETELQQLAETSIAAVLSGGDGLRPVIARRYSIEDGTVIYLAPTFCERPQELSMTTPLEPTIVYCLAENAHDAKEFAVQAQSQRDPRILYAIVADAEKLRSAVLNVRALERVERNHPELGNDAVALRELNDRMLSCKRIEDEVLLSALDEPDTLKWYWKGQLQLVSHKRLLQVLMSSALDEIFHAAPHIRTELLNRDKPSATAVAARNKLLMAMLSAGDQADLGIEKFPAEKAIYRSVLLATGLHRNVHSQWRFVAPDAISGARSRILHVWRAIESFVDSTELRARPVGELFELLRKAPFGIRDGVMPVLFVSAYLAHEDDIAIYEAGHYVPFVTYETIEKIIKTPAAFALQRFKVAGLRREIFQRYASLVLGAPADSPTLLGIVKPLARLMLGLPDYTKKTASVSQHARAVRDLFFAAKSPTDLLFVDLPNACGCLSLKDSNVVAADVDLFSKRLSDVLLELRVAYHVLLQQIERNLKDAFSVDRTVTLHELRTRLRGRYDGLEKYTIDVQGLRAFIGRLADPHGDEVQWLTSIGSFLGRKPPEKWTDDDVRAAEYRLVDLSKRLRDLERLRLVSEDRKRESGGHAEVLLMKTIKTGEGEKEVFVCLDASKKSAVDATKERMQSLLNELPDDLRLAALAVLVHDNATFVDASGAQHLKAHT